MIHFASYLEEHLLPCPYKSYLGINCPGCGMQRALVLLIKGQIWESIVMYPALIPIMAMVLLLGLHLIYKWKWGASALQYLFIGCTLLVISNFLVKNFL